MTTITGMIAEEILNILGGKKRILTVDEIKEKLNCSPDIVDAAIHDLAKDEYVRITAKDGKMYVSLVFEAAVVSETFSETVYSWGGRMV